MSRFTKDSKFRLRDFHRRKKFSPKSVYTHDSLKQEYIPIHPFSDEEELLKKIGITSSDCKSVDAWWNMGEDMCLLSVATLKNNIEHKVGIYASWPKEKQRYLYIYVVVDSSAVSKPEFENAMSRVISLGLAATENLRNKLPSKLTFMERSG